MSEESPDFKPLPRRRNKGKPRKRAAVGSETPSAPRRRSRASGESASREETAPPARTRRRARQSKPRFGWVRYLALLLIGGFIVLLLWNTQIAPRFLPQTTSVASNVPGTPSADDPLNGVDASPTSPSIFELFPLPHFPTPVPPPTPTPTIPEVAIVAGHWTREATDGVPTVPDSGAVCPDGLREVDITKKVADQTLAMISGRGYHAVLLEEFDPRYVQTPKFKPRVLLSIHADSCLTGADFAYATGYKIAHAEPSDNLEQDNRLVTCLTANYDRVAEKYNLPFNANTITRNMTEYHAFRKIDPTTPAAIIELGFLGHDREFLVNRQDEMARALTIGLDAFLQGESCLPPTATPEPTETVLP